MDIFDYMKNKELSTSGPLASRMRPKTLEEIYGQESILGKDKILYRAIKADRLNSIILFGPPGTGKTTIAKVIATTTKGEFVSINATVSGKKDMENIVKEAKTNIGMYGKKTILFIDEIHRFNKAQQDYLLPFVEDGTVILIGATTENPYFEVNKALISRSLLFRLESLKSEDIKRLVERTLNDKVNGYGKKNININNEAIEFLAVASDGDARAALNGLELAVLTTEADEKGVISITLDIISECIQQKKLDYDKSGDSHYDTISAFIKSMRGSDPDATVYYLARLIESGESVSFISRRIVICASEDVGLADSNALVIAVNAAAAVERIGLPEARIILSQAAIYIALAPKSNSAYMAINGALNTVRTKEISGIPPYLRGANYMGAKELGNGVGYKYAHDYDNHYVKQQYLPDNIKDEKFYIAGDIGAEKQLNSELSFRKD